MARNWQRPYSRLAQKYTVLRTSFDLTSYSRAAPVGLAAGTSSGYRYTIYAQLDYEAQVAEIERWVQQAIAEKFDWTAAAAAALPLLAA